MVHSPVQVEVQGVVNRIVSGAVQEAAHNAVLVVVLEVVHIAVLAAVLEVVHMMVLDAVPEDIDFDDLAVGDSKGELRDMFDLEEGNFHNFVVVEGTAVVGFAGLRRSGCDLDSRTWRMIVPYAPVRGSITLSGDILSP